MGECSSADTNMSGFERSRLAVEASVHSREALRESPGPAGRHTD